MNSIRTALTFRFQEMQCQQEIEDLVKAYLQELRLTKATNRIEGVDSRSSHNEIISYGGVDGGNTQLIDPQERYWRTYDTANAIGQMHRGNQFRTWGGNGDASETE